jgi:hypothetical protein
MINRQYEHASNPLTRHELLLAHLDYAWDRARPHLRGLTDAEYFWEPAPTEECWTVRRRDDGTYIADWTVPEPQPAPFTTIAWRLAHIGLDLDLRANYNFGDRALTVDKVVWPGSADAALAWIDTAFDRYRGGVAAWRDEDLDEHPDGPPGFLDARFPRAMGIQHITLEVIHHMAEVSLLRDLYRVRAGAQ